MRISHLSFALLALLACGSDDAVDARPEPDDGLADAGHTHTHAGDAGHPSHGADTGVGGAVIVDAGIDCTATVQLLDYALSPRALEVNSGSVVLCAVNTGKTPHDLSVRDATQQERGRTVTLQPGQASRLTLSLTAGAYTMYCSVAGHESLGMTGPLNVR